MTLKAFQLSEKVYWVGAIDWGMRDFHGYRTGSGTTYNAYLIVGDKVTLIDTVKRPFLDEMMARISSVMDPARIDYVVSGHSEPDHAGAIPEVAKIVAPERIFASVQGKKALDEHFHEKHLPIQAVSDGETLSLGNMSVTFIETRMVHWPDSMFTYLKEGEILFSQDAFGMHLASGLRYADEISHHLVLHEASRYFANILLPLSSVIAKLLEKVAKLGLPVKTVAPAHGPIWRDGGKEIMGLYAKWCKQEPTSKAVVVYDTMWGSTELMARAIGDGLLEGGATPVLMPLHSSHRSDVAAEILECGAILVGSPTINNSIFPSVADVLTYLVGLKPKNLIGAAFGSYGWSGEGVAQVEEYLRRMGVEIVGESVKAIYVPDSDTLERCRTLGRVVGEKVSQRASIGKCEKSEILSS